MWTLLTGGTGFVGRQVLRQLLEDDHQVAVLIRGKASRWTNLCQTIPVAHLPRVAGVVGDLHSLDDVSAFHRENTISRVINCAGVVDFNNLNECRKANVSGLGNLKNFVIGAGVKEFHHVSTAYVCGKVRGTISETDSVLPPDFKNVYEATKWTGERLAIECAQQDINTTIYRPTVVIGDSRTGETSCYTGFYQLIKSAHNLVRAIKSGFVPAIALRVNLTGSEPVNLVPVDHVANVICKATKSLKHQNKIYHVTPSVPMCARDVVAALRRYFFTHNLFFPEIQFVGSEQIQRNKLEEALLKWFGPYGAYFGTDPIFHTTNTDTLMGAYSPDPHELLDKVIHYAIKTDFGRKRYE